MRVGILFGGNSREREVSFAGGRTVYDNLNKGLFEPVPIFVDSFGNLVLIDWHFLYKGSIRDFYPPIEYLRNTPHQFQVYAEQLQNPDLTFQYDLIKDLGKRVKWEDLSNYIDFAFLALHGRNGEDGRIQGMLEWFNIPYTGSGIEASAFGMNKATQKLRMSKAGYSVPAFHILDRAEWVGCDEKSKLKLFESIKLNLGLPLVVKSANQGSSIGISVIQKDDFASFQRAVDKSFFTVNLDQNFWLSKSSVERVEWCKEFCDIRSDIGLPVTTANSTIYHPEELLGFLNNYFENNSSTITLQAVDSESQVICESFIEGKEFSAIVIQKDDGTPVCLPPTGIVKGKELFDYRSKYLPGLSRKITPIDLPENEIQKIRHLCEGLFKDFGFQVYARIDGFYTENGDVFLNDPNTTSGMLPSSFFFHQAAEIGLNPSQFLTYIIRTSLMQRAKSGLSSDAIVQDLDSAIEKQHTSNGQKRKIAVIMGGYSSERHISVESGRNVYEKLSASVDYSPVSVFLKGSSDSFKLYKIPINLHLKDNADDIAYKIANYSVHPVVNQIQKECEPITKLFSDTGVFQPEYWSFETLSQHVDEVFIALHGRPGEDGTLQKELIKFKLPFNGSSPASSEVTINKYETNEILHEHGIRVARHTLIRKDDFATEDEMIQYVEKNFHFPLIAKPVDDGCSSAVKKITNVHELRAYAQLVYRLEDELLLPQAQILSLKPKEEFPRKTMFLIEEFIEKGNALHFLEVTGGMLTKVGEKGEVLYEFFEPSESLAVGAVLSLEEKFLAGEGLNITPARYSKDKNTNEKISLDVRKELEKVARILNVQGYCRIDAFVKIYENDKVEVIVIEVNSLPGMTPATCIFHQCALNGYKPYEFIDNIMKFGRSKSLAS
jgi:UDP-N-acetylmuramate--alanine ligase